MVRDCHGASELDHHNSPLHSSERNATMESNEGDTGGHCRSQTRDRDGRLIRSQTDNEINRRIRDRTSIDVGGHPNRQHKHVANISGGASFRAEVVASYEQNAKRDEDDRFHALPPLQSSLRQSSSIPDGHRNVRRAISLQTIPFLRHSSIGVAKVHSH